MTHLAAAVEPAVLAIRINSPNSFSWFGRPFEPLSHAERRKATLEARFESLTDTLQRCLYQHFYCSGGAVPSPTVQPPVPVFGMPSFVEDLSCANSGHGPWESGWKVSEVDIDGIVVSRNGLTLWADPQDCLPMIDAPLAEGLDVRVRLPKEQLNLSPGFYVALGNQDFVGFDVATVRLYWNLDYGSVLLFVNAMTSALNSANTAFRLKVGNHPLRYTRCDSGVLYVAVRDWTQWADAVLAVYRDSRLHLRPRTPSFTLRLGQGVGLAEDPGGGDSFGLHRCRLLAEGLVHAYRHGHHSVNERVCSVLDRFSEAGIESTRPFLGARSGIADSALTALLSEFAEERDGK